MRQRVLLTVLTTAMTTAALQPGIAAQAATIEVVADGLDTPRGVIYDGQTGHVLVAEAGTGGPSLQAGGVCGIATGGARYCYGPTGAVFRYSARSGKARRIIEGLPSIANYNAAGTVRRSVLGLHDLSRGPRRVLRGAFGLSGTQVPFRDVQLVGGGAPDAVALAQVVRFVGHSDKYKLAGDLGAFEQTHNPHRQNPFGAPIIDSNPYGMISSSYGTVVADAAGNDLLLIRADGSLQVLAVFANRDLPQFNDFIESVPSSVAKGPDGAFYVGELTGFPYYKGQAKVWRVTPGQAPTLYADGFTTIADITFDGQGRLIVLEMAKEGLFPLTAGQDTVTGRLVRVESDGTQTTLATTGLENPGGVAYARRNVFYVTNRTTGVGGNGQLLKITVSDRSERGQRPTHRLKPPPPNSRRHHSTAACRHQGRRACDSPLGA
jgi:hypothetical protein